MLSKYLLAFLKRGRRIGGFSTATSSGRRSDRIAVAVAIVAIALSVHYYYDDCSVCCCCLIKMPPLTLPKMTVLAKDPLYHSLFFLQYYFWRFFLFPALRSCH